MLNANHFEEASKQKGRKISWDELVNDGLVIHCINCGKWIFKNWYKGPGFRNYPDMKKCAPCLWQRK
jgi:hypothetical protein